MLFGRVDVTTDIMFSQDLQQLEPKGHMPWLPPEELTTEEKGVIQEYKQEKLHY